MTPTRDQQAAMRRGCRAEAGDLPQIIDLGGRAWLHEYTCGCAWTFTWGSSPTDCAITETHCQAMPRSGGVVNDPAITVHTYPDGDRTVNITTDPRRRATAHLVDGGAFILSATAGPRLDTVDLRRLADAIDAVHAGTWQPTPPLPTGDPTNLQKETPQTSRNPLDTTSREC